MGTPRNLGRTQQAAQTPDYDARRAELTGKIAAIVLANGLEALTLRGLADTLSTSGRMLLYYFKTRDALVTAVLRHISARLDGALAQRPRHEKLTPGAFLAGALATSSDPALAPFVSVWTQVIARGARGETPFQHVVPEIVAAWLDWIENQLVDSGDPADRTRAAAILSIVEGSMLLEAARPGTIAGAKTYLVRVLDIEAGGAGRS
jgi:AcrR family transcriptional regulator